jgi:hypothetical protein
MMLLEVPDLGNVKIGAACGIAPTLRTEREEWGTHFVGCVRVIERPGHPPEHPPRPDTKPQPGGHNPPANFGCIDIINAAQSDGLTLDYDVPRP